MELQEFEIAKSSDIIETRRHAMISKITEARELLVICETPNHVKVSNCVELPNLINSADVRGLPMLDNSLKSITSKSLGDIKGTQGLPITSIINNNSTNSCAFDNPLYFSEFSTQSNNYSERRVAAILETLRLEHLNSEEIESVKSLIIVNIKIDFIYPAILSDIRTPQNILFLRSTKDSYETI